MNRPIKFRAWDKVDKVMATSESVNLCIGMDGTIFDYRKRERSDLILMQFTGLHDKNGKEIYEGDILKTVMKPEMVKVYWKVEWKKNEDGNMWGWMCKTHTDYYILDDGLQEQGEIIGNIYENPELLK